MKKFDIKQVSVRKYYRADCKGLLKELTKENAKMYSHSYRFSPSENEKPPICLVAHYNNKPIAYIDALFDYEKNWVFLHQIFIPARYQGTKLDQLLIKRVEQRAKKTWDVKGFFAFTVNNNRMEFFLTYAGYERMGTYSKFVHSEGELLPQTFFLKLIK